MFNRPQPDTLNTRLFVLGCAYSGQILSYQKMIGQLQDAGNTTTLAHYLGLQGSAWLLTGLERFTRSFTARPGLVVGTGGIPLTEFLARPAQDWV